MKNVKRIAIVIAIFSFVTLACVTAVITLCVLEASMHFHEYTTVERVEPTCTSEGGILHTCECGDSFMTDTVPPLGHSYGQWEVIAESTCTDRGERQHTCETCSCVESDYPAPMGHDYATEFTVDTQPDCTKMGSKSKHCSRCEDKTEITEIPADGHTYGQWEVIAESTCTDRGERQHTCETCSYVESDYPAPLGHAVNYVTDDEYYHAASCNRCAYKEARVKHTFENAVCRDCEFDAHPTQGLKYELNDGGGGYTVTGIGSATDENIVIFSTYNGLPVTDVGWNAFNGQDGIKSVCMYGVTTIHDYAFSGCRNLEKIVLPDTLSVFAERAFYNSNLKDITVDEANPIFHSKNNCLIRTNTKELRLGGCQSVIPDDGSVTAIGSYAFHGREGLAEIVIPNCIRSIGFAAFEYCTNLSGIKLFEGIEEIYNNAFSACGSLSEVEIPFGVKRIGIEAFSGCARLSRVIIPDSVQRIESCAFGNTAVSEIVIPKSVMEYGAGSSLKVFYGCENLVSLQVENGNPVYHSSGNCIIETSTNVLVEGCVASIIPDDGSVTAIGDGAFAGCSAVTDINLPACVTEIGANAYYKCPNLISANVPQSVVAIGQKAFYNCTGLVSAQISGSVAVLDWGLFAKCENLESVTIGEGVSEIAGSTFRSCKKLETVNIPSSVTKIGTTAFYLCESLESITIPSGVTVIENSAFYGCASLKTVIIEEGVEKIEIAAFRGCALLEEITLPKSLTYFLSSSVFENCTALKTIRFGGTAEEWNALDIGSDVIKTLPVGCRIICADGTVLTGDTVNPTV